MTTNGENRRGDLSRSLAAARRHLEKGRTQKAAGCLDRSSRKRPADLARWMDHLAASVRIAIICDRLDLARRWIRRTKDWSSSAGRGRLEEELGPELDLLELWICFYEEGLLRIDRRLEKAFARISRWKPWMFQLHCLFLLNRNRLDRFDEFIRRHPAGRIPRGTIEYAVRLEHLGIRLIVERRSSQAKTVLLSAVRMLDEVTVPERLHSRATTLTWLARVFDETGASAKALDLLRMAEEVARRFRSPLLRYDIDNARGSIHYNRGEYEQALEAYLDTCFYPTARSPVHSIKVAQALLYGARCALKLGSLSRARRLLARARPLVKAFPYKSLRGFLQLLRGDLAREAGTRAGYREARISYGAAERTFKGFGTGQKWWLGLVHLSRATLCLKEKDIARALKHSTLSLEIGMEDGAPDIQAESLLLKSFLLLHDEAPRLDIYESVLRQLGVVRDPVMMFKILANLYIYSWDLEEHLELTDLHLKQLSGLKAVLPRETYDRLYQTHVTDRVLARFRRRFSGEGPGGRRAAAL